MKSLNGIFAGEVSSYKGTEKLDKLAYYLTSQTGKNISLSIYKDEHQNSLGKNVRPALIIDDSSCKSYKFINTKEICKYLSEYPEASVFESQLRCQYKKDEFIAKYGENYKKPLQDHLSGKGYNKDCDGVWSLTIDFDSNITKRELEELNFYSKNKALNASRNKAFYAQSISTYALLFKEFISFSLEPTSIRFTGKGFQFVYQLSTPFYFNKRSENDVEQQKQFVKDVIKWLRRSLELEHAKFSEQMSGILPKGVQIALDPVFENNLYQTRRVPGSFNKKTGMYATYIFLEEENKRVKHNLSDLIDFCKENYKEDYLALHSNPSFFKSSKDFTKEESLLFAKNRLEILKKIAEERRISKTLVGSRHNFITQFTNCVADVLKYEKPHESSDFSSVLKKVITINSDYFKEDSLNYSEVKSAVKGALKRRNKLLARGDSTNLTNKTIQNFLNLDDVEISKFSSISRKVKRSQTKNELLISKQDKVNKTHLLRKEGYSYKEIAEVLGMSISSAQRYDVVLYPRFKQQAKQQLKESKKEAQRELLTTQKEIYRSLYEQMTLVIFAKKLKRTFKNYFNENVKAKVLNFNYLLSIFYKSFDQLIKASSLGELINLRGSIDKIISKLLDTRTFKNIINEIQLVSILEEQGLNINSVTNLYSRVSHFLDDYLKHLFFRTIKKETLKLKCFYPNGMVAIEYVRQESSLPFSLHQTPSILTAKGKSRGYYLSNK